MKWYTASTLLLALAAGLAYAGQRNPAPKPKPQPVVALLILHNPGKDGEIWAVGYGPESTYDFNRRARVHSQTEAEKVIALTIEAAPNRFRFAGLVRI